jgi:hypothetical protein
MSADEIRELADRLALFGKWCYERQEGDDQCAFLAAKSMRWAVEVHRFADALQEEELAR